MSDWNTFCTKFNTSQDDDKQFPDKCDANQSNKTTGEILQLISDISTLRGTLEKGGDSFINSQQRDLSRAVREKVYSFCCVMNARKQTEARLTTAKNDYEVAKGRVKSLRNPPADLSYLGTTVPFGRPLRTDSVPILLAISIALIIMSLGMILNLSSIEIAYKIPSTPSYFQMILSSLYYSYQQTNWQILAITAILSAGVAGGIYYTIQKTRPEWLGLKPI